MSKLRDEISHSLFPSDTHTELRRILQESPDVTWVEFGWGWGCRKQGKGGRSRRQSRQQSFKQHTDGFTSYTIKQTTHRASQHSGGKDWTCTVGLHRQTY